MSHTNYKQSIRQWRDQVQAIGGEVKELDQVLSIITLPVWSFSLDAKFLAAIKKATESVSEKIQADFDGLLAEVEES